MKFNVLWMDDEFGTPRMDTMFNEFLEDQKNGKYQDIEVTRCRFYNELEAYINDEDSDFSAVILDVVGPSSEESIGELDQVPFYQAMKLLGNRDLIVKVFSGDPDYAVTKGAINYMKANDWEEHQDYFYKADDYPALFKSLCQDLNEKMYVFKNREYLLDMFRTGKKYLPAEDKSKITTLLVSLREGDSCFNDKQYLRDLLKDIVENFVYKNGATKKAYQFVQESSIKTKEGGYTPKGSAGRLGALCTKFFRFDPKQNTKEDKMRSVPGDAIQLLVNACNKFNHNGDYYPSDLPAYMSMQDYMSTIYYAFLAVLSWYYNVRERNSLSI